MTRKLSTRCRVVFPAVLADNLLVMKPAGTMATLYHVNRAHTSGMLERSMALLYLDWATSHSLFPSAEVIPTSHNLCLQSAREGNHISKVLLRDRLPNDKTTRKFCVGHYQFKTNLY